MTRPKVLVTGADGYLGSAVVRAFHDAGFSTYGLIRRGDGAERLERQEVEALIGDVRNVSTLRQAKDIGFDIIISNTEDHSDPIGHYDAVGDMLEYVTASRISGSDRRPLVMFTSGSKDYGNMDELAGDPRLQPHTEESPIEPHPFAAARAEFAQRLLKAGGSSYDVTIIRPALMFGRSAGLFGLLFELAARAESTIVFNARPTTIMHAVHVDDSAAARAAAYGKQFRFEDPEEEMSGFNAHLLANTSQLVSSAKIRELTGWSDVMPSLATGMTRYRLAYEASRAR